ncbi:ComF family protein [Streptomyces sp. MUM 178J]|uniref:ComF family protein n=1 Tax=Streptomyces sp. MUM 178J TaxID=2791991 RepID=UPI001F047386|nr:ComF family protein [Streptomyces sp. MUM 178J]WRQ79683.1 ComF family protein [Streptomyces sp. MUM 178J]
MRGWWWREFSSLVLPMACGGCGAPRTQLCGRCGDALYGAAARWARPRPEPVGLPAVYAAAAYAEQVRAVLLAHKERGTLGLAGPLGVALAGAVRAAVGRPPGGAGTLLLVPVPSSRRTVRARGQDATRRMALAAARELRRTGTRAAVLSVLSQRRAVADQSGLTASQRLSNLAGALQAPAGAARLLAAGRPVLVDDLMTTGASLAEAARAVRAVFPGVDAAGTAAAAAGAGTTAAERLCAAVVAVPPLSFGPSK